MPCPPGTLMSSAAKSSVPKASRALSVKNNLQEKPGISKSKPLATAAPTPQKSNVRKAPVPASSPAILKPYKAHLVFNHKNSAKGKSNDILSSSSAFQIHNHSKHSAHKTTQPAPDCKTNLKVYHFRGHHPKSKECC